MKRYTIHLGVSRDSARMIWPDLDPSEAPEIQHWSAEFASDDDAVRAFAQSLAIHGSPWGYLTVECRAARRHTGASEYRVASAGQDGRVVRDLKPWFATFGARKPEAVRA